MVNWLFGDSFDLYSAPADAIAGYWDSGNFQFTLVAGRFAGSRAASYGAVGTWLVKSSGSNDSIHHFNVAQQQGAPLTGTSIGDFFTLGDGATAQCTIGWRGDGAIVLQSGASGGTTLAAYTGAVTVQNVWNTFEIEVVIHNTAGSFTVRKNGNTSNDFFLGSLNTRPGTTNNYANRVSYGHTQNLGGSNQTIDDFLWRSDSTSANIPWLGDIRCYARMPQADVSAQFTKTLTANNQVIVPATLTGGTIANRACYVSFVAAYTGTIPSINTSTGSGGGTSRSRCAIFTDNAGVPGFILANGTSNEIVNPGTGPQTWTFTTPPTLIKGTRYWLGTNINAGINWGVGTVATGQSATQTYASWPTDNPTVTAGSVNEQSSTTVMTVTNNSDSVSEPQQDALTTYVYDSTVGDQDFYNLAPLLPTPAATIAVTVRGFMEKSDAGLRSGAMQLRSGATTVITPTLVLSTSFQWSFQTYQNDPNTTLPWTATSVDNLNLGPRMVG
jgi:hypothetical protein